MAGGMTPLSNPSATQLQNLLLIYGATPMMVRELFQAIVHREEQSLLNAAELAARLPEARYVDEYQQAQAIHAIAVRNLDTIRNL